MKKLMVPIMLMLFVFSGVYTSFAGDWVEAEEITGTIQAVDPVAKTITLTGKKGTVVLACDLSAKTLSEVKAGDKVDVVCAKEDGKDVVKAIKKVKAAPTHK